VDDVVQRKADERHRNLIINMIVESLGVSRQAVSKWESDASDLSTTHLIVLSKLFGASTEELLKKNAITSSLPYSTTASVSHIRTHPSYRVQCT
jgi:plasmid maintenance system antidote protein VapI